MQILLVLEHREVPADSPVGLSVVEVRPLEMLRHWQHLLARVVSFVHGFIEHDAEADRLTTCSDVNLDRNGTKKALLALGPDPRTEGTRT